MKILVTGGAGFIGSNFVHYWLKNHPEDKIVVFDKLTYAGNLANLEAVKDKIDFVQGDICEMEAVMNAMTGADLVVHFAAETHVDRSIADPYVFTMTNVLGTHTLLEAARKLKIPRFHHISTDEVFGSIELSDKLTRFNEKTRYNPRSAYAASKAGSDHLVNAYFETFNLPVTISNCSNNFGPFMHPEKFIPRSIIRLLNNENIRVYTPGNQVRDWLYVEDHCRAIEAILEKGKIGETYCVGGMTEEISNMKIAFDITKLMGRPEAYEMVTDRPGHDVKYAINWNKINQELGWKPMHDFDYWLKETINWYKNNEQWWKDAAEASEKFYAERGEKVII